MTMTVVHLEDIVLLGAVSLIHVWQCGRSFEIHTGSILVSLITHMNVSLPESATVRFGYFRSE